MTINPWINPWIDHDFAMVFADVTAPDLLAGEHQLSKRLWDRVAALPGVTMYGPSPEEDPAACLHRS